ncbi:MAG: hypothetical protein ABEJ98_00980 [Candidatus Nanohaloarchaea archaeon]
METRKKLALAALSVLILTSLASGFDQVRRDEDFNATGNDRSSSYKFDGYMNKLESVSDQMQDDDEYYDPSDQMWNNSDGSKDDADQWAITESTQWVISNRGVPFPPGPAGDSRIDNYQIQEYGQYGTEGARGTYYHPDWSGTIRTSVEDGGVPKTAKAFANSFAAVAEAGFGEDEKGDTVAENDGVWIDPDDIKRLDPKLKGSWQEKVVFNIDITGPDSGLGFNVGDNADLTLRQGGKAVHGDIYFEGEKDNNDNDGDGVTDEGENDPATVGEKVPTLNPPMCGDDQAEFLLEEKGESVNAAKKDGRYACASRRDVCVHLGENPRIVPRGEYKQAGEPYENTGRLKDDREVCAQRPQDPTASWFDQDWGDIDRDGTQDTCNVNQLYGSAARRWFDRAYIQEHPYSVIGGIDDDWNKWLKYEPFDANVSRPGRRSWGSTAWNNDLSPVPTGSDNKSIATVGFCGGDDRAEYVVTQQCNTGLCNTKRDVIGVTGNPQGCIFDGDDAKYPVVQNSIGIDVENRSIYQPGETITLDPGNDGRELRKLTCFDNAWYQKFPVVFSQESVNVSLGNTENVAFQIINVRDSPRTFEVSLEPGSAVYTFAGFRDKNGDSFNTTVMPDSSKRFYVQISGGDLRIGELSPPSDNRLVVRADAVNTEMYGEDNLTVDVINSTAVEGTVRRQRPKSVPGVGPFQLVILMMIASAAFFLQS